jgi:L-alanine-DL-glutamate epimerase-like enolase superfamily enzyme
MGLCQWLADYDVGRVEDFTHPEHLEEYTYVRDRGPVPVAAGEQMATSGS